MNIGNSAVTDIIAKPTIDILLEIKEDTDIIGITEIMTRKGYIVNTSPKDIIMYLKGYGRNDNLTRTVNYLYFEQ